MTEREEKNRKLAEWLGMKPKKPVRVMEWQQFANDCGGMLPTGEVITEEWPPDFFTDEAANILLHQKLRQEFGYLSLDFHGNKTEIEACEHKSDQSRNFAMTFHDVGLLEVITEAAFHLALKEKP